MIGFFPLGILCNFSLPDYLLFFSFQLFLSSLSKIIIQKLEIDFASTVFFKFTFLTLGVALCDFQFSTFPFHLQRGGRVELE